MFSGIVEETGIVTAVTSGSLSIEGNLIFKQLKPGDSVAVNGVCLTANEVSSNTFTSNVMPETHRRTNLGALKRGDIVNLERALTLSGRLGGHLVQGHIDGTGTIKHLQQEAAATLMTISAPPEIMRYVVNKGFIAVDGLSLTVMAETADSLTVSLVQFSREHTTMGHKKAGDRVNLEADIIAKYIERFVLLKEPMLTEAFLTDNGFLS